MSDNATTSTAGPGDAPPALTTVLIPFYLYRWPSIFQFQRCEIVEGINVRTPSKTDIDNIGNSLNPTKHTNDYSPNVLISIDKDKYERHLINRIRCVHPSIDDDLSKMIRSAPDDPDMTLLLESNRAEMFMEPCSNFFRHIFMSMYLLGVRHVLAPNIVYEFRTCSNHGQWSALPSLERGLRQHEASRGITSRGKRSSISISASQLKRLAAAIEEYYWAIYARHDRLSFALGAFWNSIFTSDPVQAYLSLTIVLEALLGTGNEITHQISERVALLIERETTKRVEVYKKTKKLYGIRSSIAHGRLAPKRGTALTWGVSWMDAKGANISVPEYLELRSYVERVLLAHIFDQKLRTVIQSGKKDDLIGIELNEYYQNLIFS